jgi:anti-sigma regulatory factor (Ser/Thr protein kinase)/PAS domain-containing protein
MKIKKFSLPSNTVMLLAGGFTLFMILFIIAGTLGLYSLSRASSDTRQYIRAVDSARDIQVKFQRQFMTWKTIMLEGNNFETFKKNYHDFSFQADRVQDNLFNLASMCAELEKVPAQIDSLRAMHRLITEEYIRLVVEMEESNFRNKAGVIARAYGKDEQALEQVDSIVQEIEVAADRKIQDVNAYYYWISLVSFIAIAIAAVLMAVYISREVIQSQEVLENKVRERTGELAQANEVLRAEIIERSKAEEKYRLLVDGSSDIIFGMDEDFFLLHVNRSVKSVFKIDPETLVSANFLDLVHLGLCGDDLNRQILRDTLESFRTSRKPVEFTAAFKAPKNIEPVEMEIRLEFINIENGGRQILGKARKISEDMLTRYLHCERKKFIIRNSLMLSEALTGRITRNLAAFCDKREAGMIRMALHEIVINAIEHGNLNITFREKSEAQERGSYFSLIAERQEDPRYCDRKVQVEYSLNPEKVAYLITDEGDGFDHSAADKRAVEAVNEEMIAHGRGISIVKSVFDEVKYNSKGNQVLLIKYLRSTA